MNSRLILLIVPACALLPSGTASQDGQVGDLCVELNRQVIGKATTGQLREAETVLAEAMGSSTNRLEPGCGGLLLHNLATILYLSGRFAEAEVVAERSISALQAALGPSATGLLRPLHILASARLEQGKIGKARQAITSMRPIPLESAEDRILVHGAAAVLFHAEGRFTESESEFSAALAEWERAGKPSGAEVASLYCGLASLYLSTERLNDASRVLDRALAALTAAPNAVPMDRIRLLQVRAALDRRKGNWRESQGDLEQAIALARAEPRSDAGILISMLADYAQILRKRHQKRQARLVEQQATALQGHSAPDNTVDVTELLQRSKPNRK